MVPEEPTESPFFLGGGVVNVNLFLSFGGHLLEIGSDTPI